MPLTKSSSAEMPFLDHLEELRWRIIYALGALIVGLGIGFLLALRFNLLQLLQKPVLPYLNGQNLVYLHPADPFSVLLQMSFVVGVAVALPVIVYQAWAFLSPALYQNERRIIVPVLFAAFLLFAAGVAMAYFLVLPMTLRFFAGLGADSLTAMISVAEYFSFVTSLCLAFGLVFEVPILIVGLSAFGVVTPRKLGEFRRYAVILSWVVAAVVTPGDMVTTTILLAIPLYLLYEASVAVAYVIAARQARRARLAADGAGAGAAA